MKVAALIDDIFFTSKLDAAARQSGSTLVLCHTADEIPADAERIIVDLEASAFDPVGEIRRLKETRNTPIVAFGRHTHVELLDRAREAGADSVMPRSQFVERIGELVGP